MSDTAVLRRFNRSYTQRIGALEDSFLGTGRPLGENRLLFEIGASPATTQELRERLGLDSGYLSRLLRALEADGLVEVSPDPADRRRRLVRLTSAGAKTWEELERLSEQRALRLLEPLTARQRVRLTEALGVADLLVRAATVSLETVDPTSAYAREAMDRYYAELDERFPHGFVPDPHTDDDDASLRAPVGAFVVAVSDGRPVAGGGVRDYGHAAEIKRMWVDGGWRGAGLGSRLLRHLESLARGLGHTTVRLDTNETLLDAIAMYDRAGYDRVDRYNDNPYATHFFQKQL
ncbi:bifunctional helix-turn-helix transcriptional regulator/GNAT family N-acetyltransferase [Nocardioides sp. CER19]|uniref:bifunctional helix-turn-helix transcriptional regulator/GNAT family N-acetyltransferase n=1 Tax=Nocardioides sp. CER19 TaxID=3038538 RepID=UPI00244CA5C5|nr:bifunctional helix-turn-helix transcriptional regulator/GNAT family N-acetyltransferase [Nocardioides sp. CER19]MDH2413821.1 bifunctional helix-turn-helix transcriptional regulator/GNAT family N-acetyltransferase [Nocardioides sp. CER19]